MTEKDALRIKKEMKLQHRYDGKIFGNLLVIRYNSRGKNGLMYDVELGNYDTIEEAKTARQNAEIEYHKEYKYEE